MNNEQVLTDFRRRYEGTYVHLEIEGERKEVLAYVRSVESNTTKVGVLNLETLEYGNLQLNMGSDGHIIRFKYPQTGVFQFGKKTCVFYRRPARQYSRGLRPANSTIYDVARHLGASNPSYNFESLKAAFEHKTFDPVDALTLLGKNECRSCALESNLSLMLSPTVSSTNYLLLHYMTPIAALDTKGKIVKVLEQVYVPLINEYFQQP